MINVASAPIGLIAAIDEERSGLSAGFVTTGSRTVAGRPFRTGRLDGRPVVLVRAGIGKVNAALAATVLCAGFGCRALAVGGVAGSLDPALAIGEVVIADRVVCHDYGAQVDGALVVYQPGAPPLPETARRFGYDLPGELRRAVAERIAGRGAVRLATIASGDMLVSCPATRLRLRQDFGARAVEMEGAAVAQVARRFGVPALVVRAISDLAGTDHPVEVRRHLPATARAAAETLRTLLPALDAGEGA